MRWANLVELFAREWLPLIQYILAFASVGAAVWTRYTPTWVLAVVLFGSATATVVQDRIQRKRSEIDAELQEQRYRDEQEHRTRSEQQWEEIRVQVTERADRVATERDAIRAAASMLRRLVDDGVIDMHDILRRFDTRSALLIYVYAAAVGYKQGAPPRLYPAMLASELGCVRLPPEQNSTAFLTTESRLPAELRDPARLRGYIEHRLADLFAKEWTTFRLAIQQGSAQAKYYVKPDREDWRQQMRATVIVTEVALGPSNLIRLNGGMQTNQVFEIITEAVNLRRVELSRDRRKKVKEFMLRQTFDLVLEKEDKKVRDAMMLARTALDAELECATLFDYLALEKQRLADAIQRHTNLADSSTLAATIQAQLAAYESALDDLGVTGLRS